MVVTNEILTMKVLMRETQTDALVVVPGPRTSPVPRRAQHLQISKSLSAYRYAVNNNLKLIIIQILRTVSIVSTKLQLSLFILSYLVFSVHRKNLRICF